MLELITIYIFGSIKIFEILNFLIQELYFTSTDNRRKRISFSVKPCQSNMGIHLVILLGHLLKPVNNSFVTFKLPG